MTLLSSATLGQNPEAPTSALDRSEGREDRLVRKGIDRLRKRHGEGSGSGSSSEEEIVKGKGKGKAKEEIVHALTEGAIDVAQQPSKNDSSKTSSKKGKKTSKQADWNPNLLPTQPDSSSSSDFDSSDSENDSEPEAGPSTSKAASPVQQKRSPSPTPKPRPVASALKSVMTVAGGALRKSTDGVAVKPRVEIRRKIRPIATESSEDDSDVSGDAEDDDDDEMGDSEGAEDDGDDDEDEEGDIEDEGDFADVESAPKKRALGFKAWAQQQMDQIAAPTVDLLNTTSSSSKSITESRPSIPLPKTGHFVGPLGAQLNVPSTSLLDQKTSQSARPTVKRRPSVAEARMELPILAEEQPIIESILMNPVVVICGETGSGKTTQVPQMLYEHGFGFKSSGKLLYLFTSCFTELTNR